MSCDSVNSEETDILADLEEANTKGQGGKRWRGRLGWGGGTYMYIKHVGTLNYYS